MLEGGAPRCLDCADLGHLVFLPRGDTALTRRSREESALSAVVVRFNRRKSRYERQGVLVEEEALARAEQRCLADAEARRRRRARDARLRAAQDLRFTDAFGEAILRLFPGCPPERARAVAEHASVRGSGAETKLSWTSVARPRGNRRPAMVSIPSSSSMPITRAFLRRLTTRPARAPVPMPRSTTVSIGRRAAAASEAAAVSSISS